MNVLFIFVAGVTVGWVADRLYSSFSDKRQSSNDDVISATVETENSKKIENTTSKKTTDIVENKNLDKDSINDFHRDNLSQLKGVGPKLAKAFDELGIQNFEQLSSSSVDILLERLKKTGGRFTRTSLLSVIEQAKLARQK